MKAKYTDWQLNFFIAIMTSWTAFSIFYYKQFNKKMFDQYLKKFFRVVKKNNNIKSKKINIDYNIETKKINELISFLEKTRIESPDRFRLFKTEILFKKNTILLAIKNINDIAYTFSNQSSCNHIMNISFNDDEIGIDSINRPEEMARKLYNHISSFINDVIKLDYITLDNLRVGYTLVHDILIAILKNYISIFKENTKFNESNMNVGLEFEYDIDKNKTIPIENLLELDSPYITEISTGYDGKPYDSDEIIRSKFTRIVKASIKEDACRLNEDRIRINHFKGLQILEKYLLYLNKNGKISKSSSIHIHIDCVYDDSFKKIDYSSKDSSLFKYLKRTSYPSLLDIIYLSRSEKSFTKKGYLNKHESGTINIIKGSMQRNDLNTLEFRSFKTSFLYEDVVMYILIASYITNAIKKGTKINDSLIKTIIKANNIVKTNKK